MITQREYLQPDETPEPLEVRARMYSRKVAEDLLNKNNAKLPSPYFDELAGKIYNLALPLIESSKTIPKSIENLRDLKTGKNVEEIFQEYKAFFLETFNMQVHSEEEARILSEIEDGEQEIIRLRTLLEIYENDNNQWRERDARLESQKVEGLANTLFYDGNPDKPREAYSLTRWNLEALGLREGKDVLMIEHGGIFKKGRYVPLNETAAQILKDDFPSQFEKNTEWKFEDMYERILKEEPSEPPVKKVVKKRKHVEPPEAIPKPAEPPKVIYAPSPEKPLSIKPDVPRDVEAPRVRREVKKSAEPPAEKPEAKTQASPKPPPTDE